jgi:hypothetical protein
LAAKALQRILLVAVAAAKRPALVRAIIAVQRVVAQSYQPKHIAAKAIRNLILHFIPNNVSLVLSKELI